MVPAFWENGEHDGMGCGSMEDWKPACDGNRQEPLSFYSGVLFMSRKARMCSGIVAILITLSLHAAIAAPASSDQQKNDASPSFLLSGSDYSGLNAPSDSSTVESTRSEEHTSELQSH